MYDNVFMGLGSNLGDRLDYLRQALRRIAGFPYTEIVRVSSIYETEPVGMADQGNFLNLAAQLSTGLTPESLLERVKDIENQLQRDHSVAWGPRTIDIDLLYYGSAVMATERLKIPHPRASQRRFVLTPLCEIAPDFVTPENLLTVEELLRDLSDPNWVKRIVPSEDYALTDLRGPIATSIHSN